MSKPDDSFELYDLSVEVESIDGDCTCGMRVGDGFLMRNGKIFMREGTGFCLYALQSVVPLLPAKQRPSHPADWMATDDRVTCPDPACRLIMRIDRLTRRTVRHEAPPSST